MNTAVPACAAPPLPPLTLDHAGIAARIPHAGRMCLLDRLHHWNDRQVHCTAIDHRDATHPLRSASGLLAPCAIEYAAQAMALHGTLTRADSSPPTAGYLASVRAVQLHVPRLDSVEGALHVHADRLAGDHAVASYQFRVCDERGTVLVDGRVTLVLTPAGSAP